MNSQGEGKPGHYPTQKPDESASVGGSGQQWPGSDLRSNVKKIGHLSCHFLWDDQSRSQVELIGRGVAGGENLGVLSVDSFEGTISFEGGEKD